MYLRLSRLIFIACVVLLAVNLSSAQETLVQTPLAVLAATPDVNTLSADPNTLTITVMFDRSVVPVNALSQPSTTPILSFEPNIQGQGQWVHPAVYQFTPAEDSVIGGMQYQVTIETPLTAVDGSTLDESYTWSFQTIEPQVIEITPTKMYENYMLLDSGVNVSFSQPMDHTSTEQAFSLQHYIGDPCNDGCSNHPNDWEIIEGTFSWSDDSRQLTFNPTEQLHYYNITWEAPYRAVFETSAKNAAGFAAVQSPVIVYLPTVTRPSITSISPAHREAMPPGLQRVTINFSGAMNVETYRNHYAVSPLPPGEITPYVTDMGALQLEFEHEVDTDYTITIYAGIADIYGTPTENDVSVTYRVREPQPETIGYMQLPNGQNFVIAPTYLDNPGIAWQVPQETEYTVSIYHATYDMLFEIDRRDRSLDHPFSLHQFYQPQGYYYWENFGTDPFTIPWLDDDYLVNQHTVTLTPATEEYETMFIPLWDASDDPLPMGIYGVDVNERAGFILAVANGSITVRRSYNETLVWVTDYESAAPIADATVTVRNGSDIVTGTTNADGLVRFEGELGNGILLITSEAEGVFGVWQSASGGSLAPETPIYLYTDRPIYRPGEPVHYRGILRAGTDLDYRIPTHIETVYTNIQTNDCSPGYCNPMTLYEAQRAVTTMGTFSDSFTLPDDIAPGHYTLQVSTCPPAETCAETWRGAYTFQVAEFRIPEFTTELTPQFDEIIAGEPVNVDVFAAYYFGGAVQDAQFTRRGFGYRTSFGYQGAETGYQFGDWRNSGSAEIYAPDQYVTIQSDGHSLLTDIPRFTGSLPVSFSLEATVIDATGQAISGNTSLLIHPADVYVGLRPSVTFADVNPVIELDVLSILPDSTMRPNQVVTLEIVESKSTRTEVSFGQYRWNTELIPITTDTLQTNAQGHSGYVFQAPHPGQYIFTARTTDEMGRQAQTTVYVTAQDDNDELDAMSFGDALEWVSCEFRQPLTRLRVISDAEQYVPGDTAIIHFQNPYPVPVAALVTIERANIYREAVLTIDPGIYRYDLTLTGDDAPDIFFTVVLLRPAMLETTLPQYLQGSLTVNVDNVERRLNLSVSPSTTEAAPGQAVSFDVQVTDYQGNPVSAEVGIALTDEAIFALANPRVKEMEDHFYPYQRARIGISSSGLGLLQNVPIQLSDICGHGGGGGGGPVPTVRDDFIITPLWEPHLMTDENGQVSASVVMPDNITQWRFDARAVTADTQIGQIQSTIVTTLPLMTRSIAPRFFVVGDHLPLVAVVHNNTDQTMHINVELVQSGLTLDEGIEPIQTIDLAPHSLQRVEWWGVVDDVDGVYMETRVVSDTGLSDASIPTLTTGNNNTIPVRDFFATETVATSGILQESGVAVEQIDLRFEPYPTDGQLTVEIDSNPAETLLTSVDNLTMMEGQSNWQSANMLWIYTSLLTTDLLDTSKQAEYRDNINELLSQLVDAQESDGGWGWYANMGGSPSITATVLISLGQAQQNGLSVDAAIIQRSLDYLESFLIQPSTHTSPHILNEQAFIRYALALHRGVNLAELNEVYDYRLEMSIAARSQLLLAYVALDSNQDQVATLTSDLISLAILSGGGTHWEEVNVVQSYLGRNRLTTATTLYALLKAQPSTPIAPNAIRWLMTAQSSTGVSSLSEMMWTIAAVSEWSRQIGNAPANYDYSISLNDNLSLESTTNLEIVDDGPELLFTLEGLLPAQVNTLTIERTEGEGVLYYAAQLQVDYPADRVEAVERGVRVERQYINHATQQPVQSARIGDIIMVHLTLYVMEDMYYVTLEDILPAGLEPLDWSLNTTTTQANRSTLYTYYHNNHYWGWGLVYWSSQEIHDDGSILRAYALRRGVYSYTYPARAITPGTFLVPPTHVYAAEQPEVFGRTRADRFTISHRQP
jgi:uncharacterized protein YfaS (alpha-2-macroglobulin family)